jgi:parvulin-like peptidyl-prolyl isomerase
LALFLIPVSGCSKKEESTKAPSVKKAATSPVVAQVGINTVTADDLKAVLNTRPKSYRRRMSEEELRERLDKIILEEVLFQEALQLKIDQLPDIRRRYRTMLTQKLMDEQVNRKQWNREVPNAELKAYYDRHFEKFNRPAQVRIADIFISLPEGATDAQKAKLQKKAEGVLSEALALKGQRAGFGRLVRQYSTRHKLYGKGATGFFDIKGQPRGIDRKLAEAAFKLEKVGSISGQVITTPEGFHVIMLVGKRAALNRPLETVKNQIKRLVQREGVEKARKDFIEALKTKADIKIDETALSAVQAELAQTGPNRPERPAGMQTRPGRDMAPVKANKK